MQLALAIVFLWIGCALLIVAFHPLPIESGSGAPGDIMHALQSKAAATNSAYDNSPVPAG